MFMKILALLLLVPTVFLSSCKRPASVSTAPQSQSTAASAPKAGAAQANASSNPDSVIRDAEVSTTDNYLTNDLIPLGKNSDIVKRTGTVDEAKFKGQSFYGSDMDFLGVDGDGDFILDDYKAGFVDSIDASGRVTRLLNYLEGRPDHLFTMSMCGDIVAWSECPHGDMDPAEDKTNGASWGLYYADITTGKITRVDSYKKIAVPDGAQYHYLAPNRVIAAPDHICYIAWDTAPDGKVMPVIKLYTISTKKLEILDWLDEDVRDHAFGYPYISGDNMVWCKAQINGDGTYTGYPILYNLKTRVRSRLLTDENIINPIIDGNYIFASGQPNKTFYDEEICIYDIAKKQWRFKVNNEYSQYRSVYNDYLIDLESSGDYLTWNTAGQSSLVVFDKADDKLYNLVTTADSRNVSGPRLLDGNLLIYYDRPASSHGEGLGVYKYFVLK